MSVAIRTKDLLVLRVISSSPEDLIGKEFEVEGSGHIGRAEDCAVVLPDSSVSGHHASIEAVEDGLRLVDLQSTNGVWVDERPVSEVVIEPGQRFRIGSTVFTWPGKRTAPAARAVRGTIFLPKLPPPVPPAAAQARIRHFSVRVVQGETDTGKSFRVPRGGGVVGSGDDCAVVLKHAGVATHHVRIELSPAGFRVADLGGGSGTWVGSRPLMAQEDIQPGEHVRLGPSTIIECLLDTPAPPPQASPPRMTVVVPLARTPRAETARLAEEGEEVSVDAHAPFLLNEPGAVWYVVSGGIDIFTVRLEKGAPAGTRAHFLEVRPEQCLFGFDLRGQGSGFIALGNQPTVLRKIPLARLQQLASSPPARAALAALLDGWVQGITRGLRTGAPPGETPEPALVSGEEITLKAGHRVTCRQGTVWIDVWSGAVLFNDLVSPRFHQRGALFPVTADSWVESSDELLDEMDTVPLTTERALEDERFWSSLASFHRLVTDCEFLEKGLRLADEAKRIEETAKQRERARDAAMRKLRSVVEGEDAVPASLLEPTATEPLFRTTALVAQVLGIAVKNHPDAESLTTYQDKVMALSRASGFRVRLVALRGKWWKRDHGPLLGKIDGTNAPVALLPKGPRTYQCVDPVTGTRIGVDQELDRTLTPLAYTFYRPFPPDSMSVKDVVRFGVRGLSRDFRQLMTMGVLLGLAGTLAPFLSGKIFDSVIPSADRPMLWVFGLALCGAALGSAAFKVVQGIATLRIQGRMEYFVQSAVWDRLLNLPANFFRKYSAGDLSDRAAGIDVIQNLVSGAGVAAVLGSLSGLFYVFLMLTYDVRLTLVAIGLTLFFVGFTTVGNYLQLRHQRREVGQRGKITGLVLNLISGVAKIRVAGAEDHAFYVWAKNFAEQKRIAFRVGRIQSVVTVFSLLFPVLSSITIFATMLLAQAEAAETGSDPMSTGDFIAFTSAYGLFLAAMQALSSASLDMLRVVPIYERLEPILSTRPETDESKTAPGKLRGGIELSHIFFRYHPDSPHVLKDLSLRIEPGEFVAFVGASGCGKSTLLRILLGFEQPEKGAVFYDGKELSSLDVRMVREQLGVVLQVSRVLPAEIYRNIVGASSLTIEDAWEAAEWAGLAEDIRSMPMQMHTYVAEGGGTLSGGQRQRLLIARAIVNKPKILFLDEATSALDNRSQAVVTESMDRMKATRIVIAHRLSTIIGADKICYLEDGRVAEIGTYQELMAKKGLFAELAKRQQA